MNRKNRVGRGEEHGLVSGRKKTGSCKPSKRSLVLKISADIGFLHKLVGIVPIRGMVQQKTDTGDTDVVDIDTGYYYTDMRMKTIFLKIIFKKSSVSMEVKTRH